MPTQTERAETFEKLHTASNLFILPNAWDTASARFFEDAGFPAVATSSAGLMVSRGYPDGESIPKSELIAEVGRIASRLSVPLSADIVAGFGRTPATVANTVRRVIAAGAVGINLEDTDPARQKLFSMKSAVARVRTIAQLRGSEGLRLVINARTDALRHADGTPEERLREAVRRSQAFREAGADCVYPMGLASAADIAAFLKECPGPLNVMIRRGLPPLSELATLGVRRVSFGPAASYAAFGLLRRAVAEIREKGTYETLVEGAFTHDELGQLARNVSESSPPLS